jgi:Mrp family chromosome partitioning ATPase
VKKYIFIGADRVGKSNLILSMAKVLAKLNKKVLVVDTTISQGIKSFFDF